MKLSTKPVSSPVRTDKFPPPLMRFLRSNAGSRSRGRSRSSPIFLRKKNTAIETQEPSSPKVTCMGQVRVRRSSKAAAAAASKRGAGPTSAATRDREPTRCRCWWIQNALFCRHVTANIKPNPCHCQTVWPKWGFFRVGSFRRKANKLSEDSAKSELNFRDPIEESELEDEELEQEERVNGDNDFVSNSSTPPKNALLLTRCRSAPCRSSSLASRLWPQSEETGDGVENRKPSDNEKPCSQRHSISDEEGVKNPRKEHQLRFLKENEDSVEQRIVKSENVRQLNRRETWEDSARHPLVLMRCKSEPTRTAHKLDPVMYNFSRKRRLGFANSRSPHDL